MGTKNFETELKLEPLVGTLSGRITDLTITEKGAGGNLKSNNIIRADHEWQIGLEWQLQGTMLDATGTSGPVTGPLITMSLPGNFVVNAFLEGLGAGADEMDLRGDSPTGIPVMTGAVEQNKAGKFAPGDPAETEWKYRETITIGAGKLTAGAYKLVVTLTYGVFDKGKFIPGPMAGFVDVDDIIQIYESAT